MHTGNPSTREFGAGVLGWDPISQKQKKTANNRKPSLRKHWNWHGTGQICSQIKFRKTHRFTHFVWSYSRETVGHLIAEVWEGAYHWVLSLIRWCWAGEVAQQSRPLLLTHRTWVSVLAPCDRHLTVFHNSSSGGSKASSDLRGFLHVCNAYIYTQEHMYKIKGEVPWSVTKDILSLPSFLFAVIFFY